MTDKKKEETEVESVESVIANYIRASYPVLWLVKSGLGS